MRADRGHLKAVLRSAQEPTPQQLQRFEAFLKQTYRRRVPLTWEKDDSLQTGFRLQAGSDVYDWTLDGRVRQFRDYLRQIQPGQDSLLPLMRQAVEDWELAVVPEEIGEVLTVDSEIATVGGLDHAQYGEILLFSSGENRRHAGGRGIPGPGCGRPGRPRGRQGPHSFRGPPAH